MDLVSSDPRVLLSLEDSRAAWALKRDAIKLAEADAKRAAGAEDGYRGDGHNPRSVSAAMLTHLNAATPLYIQWAPLSLVGVQVFSPGPRGLILQLTVRGSGADGDAGSGAPAVASWLARSPEGTMWMGALASGLWPGQTLEVSLVPVNKPLKAAPKTKDSLLDESDEGGGSRDEGRVERV